MNDQADTIAFLEEYHARNGDDIRPCKVDGCGQPAVDKHGIYGRLCQEHKDEKLEKRKAERRPQHPRPAPVRTLVDRARIVEEKQAAYQTAKTELEQALANLQAALPVVGEK